MKNLWDFLFGTLLIGGAPWSILALWFVVGDLFEKYTHVAISDTVGLVITGIVLILTLVAFGAAVVYRFRKRLLPRGFIVAEVCLGVVGAILLLGYYAAVMQYIID